MNRIPFISSVALLALLCGCATTVPDRAEAPSQSSGYFLSLSQKGQLIGTGRVVGEDGMLYDVWIVPGYVQPFQRAQQSVRRSGSSFAEYVQPEKYRKIGKASGKSFKWAYNTCLVNFTAKGVPRAWGNYLSKADSRTRQRVFGWWFAYPWALLEGAVDTVVRVPVGLAGTVLGTAWGGAVVPAYYAVNSGIAGTWHFVVGGVAMPVVAGTWSTVVSLPLALVGQEPTPARADGFWMKQLNPEELELARLQKEPVRPEEVEALARWGSTLLEATQSCEEQRRALHQQLQTEQKALNLKKQQANEDIQKAEQSAIQTVAQKDAQQATVSYLQEQGFTRVRTARAAKELRAYLESAGQRTPEEIARILELLLRHPPSDVPAPPALRPKTDPALNSLRVIQDIQ